MESLKTEAVPEEVAQALWMRTVRDALATELSGGAEESKKRVEASAEKVWQEMLLPACLSHGIVIPKAHDVSSLSKEVGQKQKQARKEEEEAEARLAAIRAELAEKQKLVTLCRSKIAPELKEKLRSDASARCEMSLAIPKRDYSKDDGNGDDDPMAENQEEQALLQLAKDYIAKTLETISNVDSSIKDIQQRTDRVLSFTTHV